MNDDLFAKHSWSLDLFALRRQYKFGRCHMLWSKVGSFSLKREVSPRSVNWGDIYIYIVAFQHEMQNNRNAV